MVERGERSRVPYLRVLNPGFLEFLINLECSKPTGSRAEQQIVHRA